MAKLIHDVLSVTSGGLLWVKTTHNAQPILKAKNKTNNPYSQRQPIQQVHNFGQHNLKLTS